VAGTVQLMFIRQVLHPSVQYVAPAGQKNSKLPPTYVTTIRGACAACTSYYWYVS